MLILFTSLGTESNKVKLMQPLEHLMGFGQHVATSELMEVTTTATLAHKENDTGYLNYFYINYSNESLYKICLGALTLLKCPY